MDLIMKLKNVLYYEIYHALKLEKSFLLEVLVMFINY